MAMARLMVGSAHCHHITWVTYQVHALSLDPIQRRSCRLLIARSIQQSSAPGQAIELVCRHN
uniref:Uncharacterized protein n=1 Tax=Arundo donax TaxID=35708 RepID=A0A0A9UYK2_ARUDO